MSDDGYFGAPDILPRLRWKTYSRGPEALVLQAFDGYTKYTIHQHGYDWTVRAMIKTHDANEPEWVDLIKPQPLPSLGKAIDLVDNLRHGAEVT